MLSSAEFVALLAQRFNLGHDAAASKPILLERLENELRTRRAAGTITALVVDEAQSLTTDLLEEIRLLTNIETPDEKLLPLVLAGQPELSDRLERFELRQLKQRVALRCELSSFELSDTAAYIATRIKAAGGVPAGMFTQEAVTLIHEYSRGIPRTINVICDNALLTGMALGHSRVERALVAEVCVDLRLSSGSDDSPPTGSEALTQMPAVNATAAGAGSKDSAPGSAVAEDDTSLRSQFRFRLRAAQLDPERTVVE
jgi:general secretion pathway protein A